MKFRPCIDIHDGKVKQIVGSSLKDNNEATTNFVSSESPAFYADLYHNDGLTGGHVIMLGKGNEAAAEEALGRHPGELQVGGGINPDNAKRWLDAGAGKIIVTSWIFPENDFSIERLRQISNCVGGDRLVVDLSCVPVDGKYIVAYNRWQTLSKLNVNSETFGLMAKYCGEFLVHAVSIEGKQNGPDVELVKLLATQCPECVTYAGGIRNLSDISDIQSVGNDRVDFTIGSALDIFGGTLPYKDVVAFC